MSKQDDQINPDYVERQLIVGGIAVGGWIGIALLLRAISESVEAILLPVCTVAWAVLMIVFYVRYVWFEKLP